MYGPGVGTGLGVMGTGAVGAGIMADVHGVLLVFAAGVAAAGVAMIVRRFRRTAADQRQ